jgi:hypothetical protein
LPKAIISAFPDTQYFDVRVEGDQILLMPVRIVPVGSTLEKVRDKLKRSGIASKDVDEAIQWARKRNKK